MPIHESGENYLETILMLQRQNGFVRSVDVANALDYTKASISRAMHILQEKGYILIARSGQIELTEKGIKKAEDIYERHTTIAQYLEVILGLDTKTAEQDACRIEHVISAEAVDAMRSSLKAKMGY